MAGIRLTAVQREILKAVVDLHHSKKRTVQGNEIAEKLGRHSGTIRNQMVALRALGLVEGVSGPRGGYYPKPLAFEALEMPYMQKEVPVPLYLNGKAVSSVTVTGISFTGVNDPDKCRATIHVKGVLRGIEIGDSVAVGPTPVQELVLKGTILGRDDIDNVMVVDVHEILGIPRIKIKDIATSITVTVSPETAIKEAAKRLSKGNVRGTPVIDNGKIAGIVSTVDITKAIAESKEGGKVRDIMRTNITTINEKASLSKAIELSEKNNISRLIVTDNEGKMIGIVTRTDMLARLGELSKYYFT